MSVSSTTAGGAGKKPRRFEWVKLVLVPVVVALVIAALTPLGDGVREVLFPTKAAVLGTVTMSGQPVDRAALLLDGRNAGSTDAAGAYLLTGVDDGNHVLEVLASGAHPGRLSIAVQRGASEIKVDPLDLRPLVQLGFAITSMDLKLAGGRASPGGFILDYDFTLWILGDADTLGEVKTVSYAPPAPLTSAPAAGTDQAAQFCYRQAGAVSFDRVLGSPGLGAASATVTLNDGQSFTITGPAGDRVPPPCTATEVATQKLPAGQSPTSPPRTPSSPGGDPEPSPSVSSSSPTPTPESGPRILSFAADATCNPVNKACLVTFIYEVRDADTIEIALDNNVVSQGALFKMPSSTSISYPYDGEPHTATMTVSDSSSGRRSEPSRVPVKQVTTG